MSEKNTDIHQNSDLPDSINGLEQLVKGGEYIRSKNDVYEVPWNRDVIAQCLINQLSICGTPGNKNAPEVALGRLMARISGSVQSPKAG